MAKSKAKSSNQRKSTASAGRRSAAQNDGRKSAGVRESDGKSQSEGAARKRVLSQDEIGLVAGEIWQILSERGGQNLASLKKSIDAPGDLVLAATGWLAREGKLDFNASGRTVNVSLR